MLRRAAIVALIALLLGAISTVAVAWYVASKRPNDARWVAVTPNLIYAVECEDQLWFVSEGHAIAHRGVFIDIPTREDDKAAIRGQLQRTNKFFQDRSSMPAWARNKITVGTVSNQPGWYDGSGREIVVGRFSYVVNAYGWPSLAMRGIRVEEIPWGLAHKSPNGPFQGYLLRGTRPIALPLGIIWPGFLIDTLNYAAAWFVLLFAGLRATRALITRRRLRRGQCPVCRYNLLGDFSSGCPECGWNRAGAPRST